MSFGFPTNPSNKKQYISDGKSFEYDSDRGAWVVSVRPAVSASTTTVTDLSQLADPNSLLNNASSTLPVYTTEVSLYDNTANLDVGQMAYVSENGKIAIWNGSSWFGATTTEYVPPPPATWYGDRGIYAGGRTTTQINEIVYVDISNPGSNAQDFGDLQSANWAVAGASDGTYGIFAGGIPPISTGSISYITIANTSTNAQTFGDLTQANYLMSGAADGTLAVFGGGQNGDPQGYAKTSMEYITVASVGNATEFGNLSVSRYGVGSASDGTYGIWAGGRDAILYNVIDYFTFSSANTAQDFGDLNYLPYGASGVDDGTYAVFAGGSDDGAANFYNNIDYITVVSPSNATTFGSLSSARQFSSGSSNATYGLFAGGKIDGSNTTVNTIDYITIITTGSTADFGNLVTAKYGAGGCSGSAA